MTTSAPSGAGASARSHNPATTQENKKPIYFGPFEVTNQVFLTTRHSFALVNLKPLLPGHVLVCPFRPHRRLTDLTPDEVTDLFLAVQRVQRMLARYYFQPSSPSPSPTQSPFSVPGPTGTALPTQGSFNIALQDGAEAGQTVPHVHVHVIPRIRGSTAKPTETPSDRIYEQMADEEGNVGGALQARSMAEMEEEAALYRQALKAMEQEEEAQAAARQG
ncbi:bis(5'-adenosyl)-triphosphatase-like protein [Thermochaetoides thermophila DSM 1495]|uniref:Bis(5'-adenosyl)-triphosphatase n=1 Tax=Chaetomium thermophilum (strain DSM 1495 / CBS 144.50 / IMI 039719) TaxID=759272 RepID=G0S5H0_CHATD|nr:bis(5'-adenosyl)-triphosphatase-like protein [Thermochaetoides thermophila DSM 1495]EGS21435.1 bis(5'-adenosyl)-triphosphatase-like protein [Thermochaetoides thermophila DSM 1495]